ncbi:MAG: FAD-dependent oxidoreductase, partial [Acidimicrobiia bacterium]|nr:FAD-dependent oxidoreductase [Acidimicrobiia bacterium]
MPTALIIGGGFAGSEVARRLGGRFDVTVVAEENFHLFTPMLAEVAAGDVEPSHIVSPLRQLCPKARIVVGSVVSVDVSSRSAVVRPQIGDNPVTLSGDYLILAAGSVSRDFGIPGVAEHALEF